tara:strand:- start:40 stop:807 length:768 start_codon:yes stop_codon:yes gene_type:complete
MSSRIGLNDLSIILIHHSDNEPCDQEMMIKTALDISETEQGYEAMAIFYEKKLDYENIEQELYDKVVYNYEKALEINPKCSRVLYNYSDFWKMTGNLDKCVLYLERGAIEKDQECILILIKHYYTINDMSKYLYYFLMTDYTDDEWVDWDGDNGSYSRYHIFHKFVLEKILEVFELLNTGDIELPDIEAHKNRIRNSSDVCAFIMKKELFTRLNNIHDCVICYENKLNICLDCGHELCLDCYKRVYNDSCHFCRF